MTTCHVFRSLADQTRSLRLKVQKVDEPSRELCSELSIHGQRIYFSEDTKILEDIEKLHVGQIGVDKSTSRDHPAFLWQVIACRVIGAYK